MPRSTRRSARDVQQGPEARAAVRGPALRDRLIEATRELVEERGLAKISSRVVAERAGCSDGALYNHFDGMADLLCAVFLEEVPPFSGLLYGLAYRVGTEEVEQVLTEVHSVALSFYRRTAPLLSSMFASPDLLDKFRTALRQTTNGPAGPVRDLAVYLAAEQRMGRVRADVDPAVFGEIFLGNAFERAFREELMGGEGSPLAPSAMVEFLVQAVTTTPIPRS
ncbi:TetR/AcrR family transcriptional regulator [Nocardia brasiliensis]